MSSGKHLVLFSPGFPENEKDWYCIPPLQGFVVEFQRQNPDWHITVVALHYPYKPANYQWKGVEVIALGGNNIGFPRRIWLWRKALKTLKKIHENRPIAILHTFWLQECALLGQRFVRKLNIPHFCTLMGQDVQESNAYLKRIPFRNLQVIAISERAAETFSKNTGQEVAAIVPWGLDDLGQKQAVITYVDRKKWVIGVGNLVPVKGWFMFLYVLAELKRNEQAEGAMLIGGGPQEKSLKDAARLMGLDSFLHFTGHLDRPEILSRMAECGVLLHTAASEGQGYVFLEAQAQGLPIVSTAVGMARESANWRLGDSVDALAEGCAAFLEAGEALPKQAEILIEETVRAYTKYYLAQS